MATVTPRRLKRDWERLNPVLGRGDPGIEINSGRMKVGDGRTRWRELPFVNGVSLVEPVVDYQPVNARIPGWTPGGGYFQDDAVAYNGILWRRLADGVDTDKFDASLWEALSGGASSTLDDNGDGTWSYNSVSIESYEDGSFDITENTSALIIRDDGTFTLTK